MSITGKSKLLTSAGLLIVSALGRVEDVTVLATTYDIKMSLDSQEYRVSSRDLVRSGNEIPNSLQNFKIGLRIFEKSAAEFLVQVVIYEKEGTGWHAITVPPLEFGGELGVPTEYVWESGGINLDLAIVVGLYSGGAMPNASLQLRREQSRIGEVP